MYYLYHNVPLHMRGKDLLPLNQLKELHPDLYTTYLRKYSGRMELLDVVIPTLSCLWNDVIHFSPVHPADIKKALGSGFRKTGFDFYQIDPASLDPKNTTVYLSDEGSSGVMRFADFNMDDLAAYSVLPERTKLYYEKSFAQGNQPLLFDGIPHILYKGSIDIKDLKIIKA